MPETIRVTKLDSVWVRLDCPSGVFQEIYEQFSFRPPGYQFVPAFKNKFWDGYVRLCDLRTHRFYVGLLEKLKEFASSRDYLLELDEQLKPSETVSPNSIFHFCKDLKLHAHGTKIEAHDYQLEAIHHALNVKRAVLVSPTASGKSLVIYALMRAFLLEHPGERVLIVVPTVNLVEQMSTDFADYHSGDDQLDSWTPADIHRIYSGQEKFDLPPEKTVIVSTWQSLFRLPRSWFETFGMVVGDEAHNFKAKSLCSIMEKLGNAEYRIGTTGTLDGAPVNEMLLTGLFGPVCKVISTKELMDSNRLAKLSIDILQLKYPDPDCQHVKNLDYQAEIDFIVRHPSRNRFIRNLALAQTCNTLVLFNFVEKHGKPLYESIIKKTEGTGRKVFYVSGEVPGEDRELVRAITEKESNAIIVASMGTFATGVNVRNLSTIIFASPVKSQIRVLQSIGRGLRKTDDDKPTKVFDLADDLHWKKHRNFALQHATHRMGIYSKELFDMSIHEVLMP